MRLAAPRSWQIFDLTAALAAIAGLCTLVAITTGDAQGMGVTGGILAAVCLVAAWFRSMEPVGAEGATPVDPAATARDA